MMEKIESEVSYDDRRKELTHITKETREAKIGEEAIGEILITSKGVYNEKGIRKILNDLTSKKEILEKNVETLKELQEESPLMERDLIVLKENLKKLQLIDHKEKASEADLKKEVEDLKKNEKDLKQVSKDIQDIKNAIGSRLKL